MRTMASISAAPARLPTTLPTTCGGARGVVLPVELAPGADELCAGAAGLPDCPPPLPPPPFCEGLAGFEDAVKLPMKSWTVSVLVKNGIGLEADIDSDGDADDEAALSKDVADAVGDIEGVLAVGDCDAGMAEDATLLPEALAGVELVKAVVTCNASADAPDAYGYAGTEKPLGNGGTEGTCGKASVGNGGTAGT